MFGLTIFESWGSLYVPSTPLAGCTATKSSPIEQFLNKPNTINLPDDHNAEIVWFSSLVKKSVLSFGLMSESWKITMSWGFLIKIFDIFHNSLEIESIECFLLSSRLLSSFVLFCHFCFDFTKCVRWLCYYPAGLWTWSRSFGIFWISLLP